ncbi:hypothetical protein PQE70_gp029 [Bacillus phage vB_BanS_Nate]|uniref:Uncharacterized protein n=1 Tax=Bacillus phage vB_BanS_Nate TaxID=2894788 RepID=A0AAE9CEF6_9CAUD|nr:hypothetical protein PQE70_gp029 [Bacillus phage vB_BanS_Nate]UGO50882.1 hypothetical protein NATE_29 [Bacillus phage vB_BanS_Nate]
MGRQIRTNGDKWEVFSTVTDEVIGTFENQHEVAVWLANDGLYRAKLNAIDTLMTFPARWTIDDKYQNGSGKAYYSWLDSLYARSENGEDWYQIVDDKLEELMKKK